MIKLKSLSAIILVLLLSVACKKEISTKPVEQEDTPEVLAVKPSDNFSEPTMVLTETGKSIKIVVDKIGSSNNDIQVIPLDFEYTKDTFPLAGVDPLQHVWVEDLDQNGYDEIYLITASSGSGSYSKIYGFASNKDLSMTPIYLPEIYEEDLKPEGNYYGYMGHDSIYVDDQTLYRKYPVYLEGDKNCCPSGGDKILSYQLKPGEASWQLELVKK